MMETMSIGGAWTVTPPLFTDHRGSFREWFREGEFAEATGREMPLQQANSSTSRRDAIRGIHFTDCPPGQAKFAVCATGTVLDVVVDVRAGSPTFGRWEACQLYGYRGVFLSEGLGHAWMSVTREATLIYLCSVPYQPEREHTVNPLDPRIGIRWPLTGKAVLSQRDQDAPTLAEALNQGILPAYECA